MSDETTDRPQFALEGDERKLLILTTENADRPASWAPLWQMEFDRDYPVRNAVIWVGEHEHLWAEWKRIAEERGPDALQSHIEEIWETQPIEHADTLVVTRHADNLGIDMQVMMMSHRANIVSHRFDSEQECVAFDEWLTAEGAADRIWQLVELGCLDGRNKLHWLIGVLTGHVMEERYARLSAELGIDG